MRHKSLLTNKGAIGPAQRMANAIERCDMLLMDHHGLCATLLAHLGRQGKGWICADLEVGAVVDEDVTRRARTCGRRRRCSAGWDAHDAAMRGLSTKRTVHKYTETLACQANDDSGVVSVSLGGNRLSATPSAFCLLALWHSRIHSNPFCTYSSPK